MTVPIVLGLAEKLTYVALGAVAVVAFVKREAILDWIIGDIDTDWGEHE